MEIKYNFFHADQVLQQQVLIFLVPKFTADLKTTILVLDELLKVYLSKELPSSREI